MTAARTQLITQTRVGAKSSLRLVEVSRVLTAAWSKAHERVARMRVVRGGDALQLEFADAWQELRSRSELTWVPPLWRANSEERRALRVQLRHALSALDENLRVEVRAGDGRSGLCVRVATGPLGDRLTLTGVADPTAPSAQLHPELDVTAASFEEAIIALRDAARKVYGPVGENERADAADLTG